MQINKKKIFLAYQNSIKNYSKLHKSKHWEKNYKKKIELIKNKDLENFRNNKLSDGLDVKSYDLKIQKKNLNDLIKDCGLKFVYKNLCKKNIGNLKYYGKLKDKFLDNNQFYSIKWLYILKKILKKNDINLACEIGGGFGCFAEKLIKNFNCKYILVDLPEANIISAYYLSKHFPKKKIFLYNSKVNIIDKKILNKYDILIIPPWIKFKETKIDLFLNTRSFMEMNKKIIKNYFDLINRNIKVGGFFFNNNRYYKDTVGHPIKFFEYPYGEKWNSLFSKKSWNENHCHTLVSIKTKNKGNIKEEINKIKLATNKFKIDKYFFKRIIPTNLFNLLIIIKNYLFQK